MSFRIYSIDDVALIVFASACGFGFDEDGNNAARILLLRKDLIII